MHVNTGYTTVCPQKGEIVIYRKEEWFKVFLHETIHHFSVDFSHMDQRVVKERILRIFNVDSEVNLYESYTEWWAEIFNIVFSTSQRTVGQFTKCMKKEVAHGFTQMRKVLRHMGITYHDLVYNKNERNKLFREKSNVLAYYIIHQIILYYWQDFLVWCHEHNRGHLSVFEIDHNHRTLITFIEFIETRYNTDEFMKMVKNTNKSLFTKSPFSNSSLRMTMHEAFH
jgi:hypothetical protein